MATVLSIPRPSMGRAPSFEQARARSTPPFTSTYDRTPSPQTRPQHSRTSSSASASAATSSPYQQPFNPNANSFFPTQPHAPPGMYNLQPHSWSTTALPASAFYANPYYPTQGGPVFHAGFQQSHADFHAWANAYQHMNMMMASMSNGSGSGNGSGNDNDNGNGNVNSSTSGNGNGGSPQLPPGAAEYRDDRRHSDSGPQQPPNQFGQGWTGHAAQSAHQQPATKQALPQQPFHPYKRAVAHRPSGENMSRSASQPNLASVLDGKSPSSSISSTQTPTTSSDHHRSSSIDSSGSSVVSPRFTARTIETKETLASEQPGIINVAPARTESASAPPKAASPTPTIRPFPQPLHTGPIANAINTPQSTNRPSPLSQATVAPSPEPEKAKVGLKGRFFKKEGKRQSTPPPSTPSPAKAATAPSYIPQATYASPSETSTPSATPPATPPQDLEAPMRPFAMNTEALGSQVSLAETERTATAPSEMTGQKPKRSLFRMKNMSTDNISLSSTVSSASMMIRKMGLAGISKIFKDKPKDEDAGLPEKEVKQKKDKKKKGKAEPSAAAVTHATAETEDEDRALAGLSPAAKLARQHTLRSRAEQAKKDAEKRPASASTSDEYPSIGVVSNAPVAPAPIEVLRVTARPAPTIVHAVAVSEHEYDSEDDSSEGETVEDITEQMGKTSLSDDADREFQARWGSTYIDRNAVPKKSILKAVSLADVSQATSRTRTNSSASRTSRSSADHSITQSMEGLLHPIPNKEYDQYDPFAGSFVSFDSAASSVSGLVQASASGSTLEFSVSGGGSVNSGVSGGLYLNPLHNTSAPALALAGTKPPATRSMTVPARKRLLWAPECAVYQTYDPGTYDRRSEPATCNRLTPELAMAIKQELNAFKMEMPVHPNSKCYTHYFA